MFLSKRNATTVIRGKNGTDGAKGQRGDDGIHGIYFQILQSTVGGTHFIFQGEVDLQVHLVFLDQKVEIKHLGRDSVILNF